MCCCCNLPSDSAVLSSWARGVPGTGIVAFDGVGQCEAQWFVRRQAAVQQAFGTIWGTNELLTSFDGMCLFRPWDIEASWKTKSGWFHVDQVSSQILPQGTLNPLIT